MEVENSSIKNSKFLKQSEHEFQNFLEFIYDFTPPFIPIITITYLFMGLNTI